MFFALMLLACPPSTVPGDEIPLSAAMLDYEDNPRRKLWLFTEDQGLFSRQEPHVAKDISSLGAVVYNEELILTGICWWPGCGSEAEMEKRQRLGPLVFGIATTDLTEWRPLQWRLWDPQGFTPIDPQLRLENNSLSLWYFGATGQAHRDPADRSVHSIRRAPIQDDGRFHVQETVLSYPGLADPSPITFKGHEWLFATQFAGEKIVGFHNNAQEPTLEFKGVSVPFALEVREELWLLGTRMVQGVQQPVRAISTDGQTFSAFSPFLPVPNGKPCASPVGAVLKDQVVVFCVEEPTRPG